MDKLMLLWMVLLMIVLKEMSLFLDQIQWMDN